MKFLLPPQFKKPGAIMAIIGFALWICMQFGIINKLLVLSFGEETIGGNSSTYHYVNVIIAILSFISFLIGMYFLSFSKEKIEDEMVQKIRLDSFQFAALIQMIFIIVGFLTMIVFGSPNEGLMMLFFISLIFIFWLSYIFRFNFTLHFKKEQ